VNSNPRQINLLDTVRTRGSVTVEQLADMLGVTLQTVRRDVQRLADEGLLTRFHGGVRVPSSTTENIGYQQRETCMPKARRASRSAWPSWCPTTAR
jgi:DeoR family glycerol-3-phosphate regulon repressor